jgi:hypothetical protein
MFVVDLEIKVVTWRWSASVCFWVSPPVGILWAGDVDVRMSLRVGWGGPRWWAPVSHGTLD